MIRSSILKFYCVILTTLFLTQNAAVNTTIYKKNNFKINLTGYADGSFITWQVGGAYAFGWTAGAGAGTPAFPAGGSVVAPYNASNTFVVNTTGQPGWAGPGGTTSALGGSIHLQPGDALVLNVVTDSSTFATSILDIQTFIS